MSMVRIVRQSDADVTDVVQVSVQESETPNRFTSVSTIVRRMVWF